MNIELTFVEKSHPSLMVPESSLGATLHVKQWLTESRKKSRDIQDVRVLNDFQTMTEVIFDPAICCLCRLSNSISL